MLELGKDCKIVRLLNDVAAGTGDTQTGSTVDMQGFDNCLLLFAIGAVTATGTAKCKAGQGAAANGSDASDLAGSGYSVTVSNKLAVLDIIKPTARYITPAIVRATANVVIDSVVAILYNGRTRPEVVDASVANVDSLYSPALGAA